MHLRKAPNTVERFLEYQPQNNAALPTQIEPRYVEGKSVQPYDPKMFSRYGTKWNGYTFLSKKQQEELAEKRRIQQANRRHLGPSPLDT